MASCSITYLTLLAGMLRRRLGQSRQPLHAQMSWQNVYQLYAGLNLFVRLPVHAWLARRQCTFGGQSTPPRVEGILLLEPRGLGFALVITAFSLLSLSSSAVLAHMVPLQSGLGLGTSSALIGGLSVGSRSPVG